MTPAIARLFSGAVTRALLKPSRPSVVRLGSAFEQTIRCSSSASGDSADAARVAADPDTHGDFLPASKEIGVPKHDRADHHTTSKIDENAMHDLIEQDVKDNPVVIYMKGVPGAPRCGFSALAVRVLDLHGVPVKGRDILADPVLKESVKKYTNWPTFPQIFIKGEFIGGSDIILSMHQKGELDDLLKDIVTSSSKNVTANNNSDN